MIRWLRHRLNERSTWVAIGAAIGAASVFPTPYSWLALAAGIIGTLVPDGGVAS